MLPKEHAEALVHFLFEAGAMRKIARAHRETLGTDDLSDNNASHSFRVALIGWFLAKAENADPYKVLMMCLFHDIEETRSGDHNWLNKRYVKIFEDEISQDQLNPLPEKEELTALREEYKRRESPESQIAKDADLLDQVFLIKEYMRLGNEEARKWIEEKRVNNNKEHLFSETAKQLMDIIPDTDPGDWFRNFMTHKNR